MSEHYDPFKEDKDKSKKQEPTAENREFPLTQQEHSELEGSTKAPKDPFVEHEIEEHPSLNSKREKIESNLAAQEDPFDQVNMGGSTPSYRKYRPLSAYSVAGFWQRMVALLIDLIIASGFSSIFTSPVMALMGKSTGPVVAVVAGFFSLLYFVLSTKITNGQTLGKMILGLRVIHPKEETLSWTTVIIREGFGRFIQNKFIPIYLVTAFTPQKQHLVDLLCDTYVVKEEIYALEQRNPDFFFQYS